MSVVSELRALAVELEGDAERYTQNPQVFATLRGAAQKARLRALRAETSIECRTDERPRFAQLRAPQRPQAPPYILGDHGTAEELIALYEAGLNVAPGKLRQGCASAARIDGEPMTEADYDAVFDAQARPATEPLRPPVFVDSDWPDIAHGYVPPIDAGPRPPHPNAVAYRCAGCGRQGWWLPGVLTGPPGADQTRYCRTCKAAGLDVKNASWGGEDDGW